MNTSISPFKQSPYQPAKHGIPSFKKFKPRTPKQDEQLNSISPLKYMNTDANPEMDKNLTLSAHHIGQNYNRNEYIAKPNLIKKQSFAKSTKFLDKNTSISPNTVLNTNFLSPTRISQQLVKQGLRNRKLSCNEICVETYEPKFTHRKSEIKPNIDEDQFVQIRDRKLSYQVSSTHLSSSTIKKQNNPSSSYNHLFLSPDIASRRQSDLSPMIAQGRNKFQSNQSSRTLFEGSSYSHPVIPHPESTKSSTTSYVESKFRKNSGPDVISPKDNKTQVPSFLLKKMKKQNSQPTQKQQFISKEKQRPSTHIPQQNSMKQKTYSLKDFILLKQLGEGKFGKVLLVRQKASGFICAMKAVKKSQIKSDNFIDQFIREMKIQMFLNHPNVVKMYGYFDDLSFIYILLEVATEGTLYSFLQNLHRQERLRSSRNLKSSSDQPKSGLTGLSLKQTAVIMYQLCSAINYLHSHNIIHRDLKPQNIVIHEVNIFQRQKTIKLCDFGWSVFKGSQMRTTFCGTPLYLCPQLIIGEQYDEKVDIWAIGIMLHEFLIGPNPFNIKQQNDLTNIVYKKVDLNKDNKDKKTIQKLDQTVIDLINGCLNKDPLERYDIKQIYNHEFFKKFCPELINGNNSIQQRPSGLGVSQ